MQKKIKLIWDFRGPESAKTAEHHEIHLKLPDDVNATHAKVIVMYEDNTKPLARKWDKFFASKSVFDDDFLAGTGNGLDAADLVGGNRFAIQF